MIVPSLALLAVIPAASAQEQEGKLINRILKPNMSLVNSAQDKRFVSSDISVASPGRLNSFSIPNRAHDKSFAASGALAPRRFAAPQFSGGNSTAQIPAKSQLATSSTLQVPPAVDRVRVPPESGKALAAAPFAGSRPFLGQGKSQKALRARDTPLTIEQVRELLNKNK